MSFIRILRGLARMPSFSLTVAITLAVGVAALAITFGVVDAAIWRQPPFDDAARIVMVRTDRAEPGSAPHAERWSFARLRMLRETAKSFELVANFGPSLLNLTGGGDAEQVPGEIVSPEYFPLLRATPLRGRTFAAPDDDPLDPHPVAIIGFEVQLLATDLHGKLLLDCTA
jgi:putative ABC transport system permease protein